MSKELKEIKEIRKEKASLDSLIRTFQRMSDELKEKEEFLLRRIEKSNPLEYNKEIMKPKSTGEYLVVDLENTFPRVVESAEMKQNQLTKLREEVLSKQFENMKLEKQVQARKEEHLKFHAALKQRKEALEKSADDLDTEVFSDASETRVRWKNNTGLDKPETPVKMDIIVLEKKDEKRDKDAADRKPEENRSTFWDFVKSKFD